jgi:AraC-like DNA-binding protein
MSEFKLDCGTSKSGAARGLSLVDSHNGTEVWRKMSLDYCGVNLVLQQGESARTRLKMWRVGAVEVIALDAVSLCAEQNPQALEQFMFLKLVKSGKLSIISSMGVHVFEAGDLVISDPRHNCQLILEQHTELIALKFPRELLLERGLSANLPRLLIPDAATADARALGDAVWAINAQNGETSSVVRERQGEHLLDLLTIVAGGPSSITHVGSRSLILSRVKKYIAQHLHDVDLDAECIASSVGVSRAHLYRIFDETGTSLMRYVWWCRLDRAAELLARRSGPAIAIREIAYRCGFENAANFSRTFKKRFGITPKEMAMYGVKCGINKNARCLEI